MHVYTHFYTHVYAHVYVHVYTHVHMHAYIHAYRHAYTQANSEDEALTSFADWNWDMSFAEWIEALVRVAFLEQVPARPNNNP